MRLKPAIPDSRRMLGEVLALGVANGVFIGAGFMARNPAYALLAAFGAGSCVTLCYLFVAASRRA